MSVEGRGDFARGMGDHVWAGEVNRPACSANFLLAW